MRSRCSTLPIAAEALLDTSSDCQRYPAITHVGLIAHVLAWSETLTYGERAIVPRISSAGVGESRSLRCVVVNFKFYPDAAAALPQHGTISATISRCQALCLIEV